MKHRKLMTLFLALIMTLSFTPFNIANAEAAVGAWQINASDLSPSKNPEAKAAFDKAMDGIVGVNYKLIACLGSQVVQGTNYCLLCEATAVSPNAKSTYVLVYVYEDLEGKAEVTDVTGGIKARTTARLRVRKGPGTDYDIIKTVNRRSRVSVYGLLGEWAFVSCGTTLGWMNTKYLKKV
ncbi:MAG: SH3 domain-containing protein [Clostridia bacterium]|nr:SH3 domain-containing protein [Clostridia bacterium]